MRTKNQKCQFLGDKLAACCPGLFISTLCLLVKSVAGDVWTFGGNERQRSPAERGVINETFSLSKLKETEEGMRSRGESGGKHIYEQLSMIH